MIKGMIFDLDMCIFDTRSLGAEIMEPVFNVLEKSNLSSETKKQIKSQLWTTSLEDTVAIYDIPDALAEKMRGAYQTLTISDNARTFGDEHHIESLPVKNILVTSGYREFQMAKIEKTNITHLFDEIIVDSVAEEGRKGKTKIFQEILKKHQWNPDEVLVIGDNPYSELKSAKELHIFAIQTLRPTVEKWSGADAHITSLEELKNFV